MGKHIGAKEVISKVRYNLIDRWDVKRGDWREKKDIR